MTRACKHLITLIVGVAVVCAGCRERPRGASLPLTSTPLPYHHELSLSFPEGTNTLHIQDEIHFDHPVLRLEMWLSSSARITHLELDGRGVDSVPNETRPGELFARTTHHTLLLPFPASVVRLSYELASEEPLETLSVAHAGALIIHPEGLFLPAQRAWYPRFAEARPSVSIETLVPHGLETCAEGHRIGLPAPEGQSATRFESENPSEGLTLIAGKWVRDERRMGQTVVRTLLRPEHREHAERYFEILAEALPVHERRIGPYPFASFTVVEFPTRSLMAFPGYTIAPPILASQPDRWQIALEHELLHAWWGHLVFLGAGSNWIEGLVTYLAEHEHRGRDSRARARSFRKHLLRTYRAYARGEADIPITAFRARHSHADQSIGYAKSAMVFHMLRRRIGERAFFEALQELTTRYRFRAATWNDLIALFETHSEQRLGGFYIEWLERGGAPSLSLKDAINRGPTTSSDADHAPHRLELVIEQAMPTYALLLPVSVTLTTGVEFRTDVELASETEQHVFIELPAKPVTVYADPGYDLFRVLNHDELEPTVSELMGSDSPQIALEPGLPEAIVMHTELAMAAELAGHFEQVEVIDPQRALLQLTSTPPHPVPAPLSYDPQAQRWLLSDTPLPHDASLLLALPREEGTPVRVTLIPGRAEDTFGLLAKMNAHRPFSYVVVHEGKVIARGVWMLPSESMTRGAR